MKKYNCIVVGSGISGLTLTHLLSMGGQSVLLLEKEPTIGGSLSRFYRQGVPFDTGFHFTGGLTTGRQTVRGSQVLSDMLAILGIEQDIEPIFFKTKDSNRIVLESEGKTFSSPLGYEETAEQYKVYFPNEAQGIDRYFELVRTVCEQTIALDLRDISFSQDILEADRRSVSTVINEIISDPQLKALLCAFSMCYGANPDEISFADHSRICYGLYDSLAYIKKGGDAFIDAFKTAFTHYPVDIRCKTYITGMADIKKKHVGRFILNTGEEVKGDHCIFTIHPAEILKILPREHFRKAFYHRVGAFEDSAGFFSLYGTIDGGTPSETDPPFMTSLFPSCDIEQLLSPNHRGDQAMMIMHHPETIKGKTHTIFKALELSYPEHTRQWTDSQTGKRPQAYYEYKEEHQERMRQRILQIYPEWEQALNIYESASILTHRDYLHTPSGGAYGIKQKVGQFNLFGRMSLRNLYAAGQSALLPGIVGAMMSSFILCRLITGKNDYSDFIRRRLSS